MVGSSPREKLQHQHVTVVWSADSNCTVLRIVSVQSSPQVGVEIPIDSEDADDENKVEGGRTLLNILSRGYAEMLPL